MKKLIEVIAQGLVTHQEQVSVTEKSTNTIKHFESLSCIYITTFSIFTCGMPASSNTSLTTVYPSFS